MHLPTLSLHFAYVQYMHLPTLSLPLACVQYMHLPTLHFLLLTFSTCTCPLYTPHLVSGLDSEHCKIPPHCSCSLRTKTFPVISGGVREQNYCISEFQVELTLLNPVVNICTACSTTLPCVTTDRIWIGELICWTLIARNYK
jgi:hypothetical protein